MSDSAPIYLDNAATTRVAPEVRDAMLPFIEDQYANPATLYGMGREASAAVETARQHLAQLIGAEREDEIVFTSGGTESDNWAVLGTALSSDKTHFIASVIEHHAVLETFDYLKKIKPGVEVTLLPVDHCGRVNPNNLRAAMRSDTALVSIMMANNEIGTIQPIAELAAIAHEGGAFFHTDAVQAVGKIAFKLATLPVDLLSLSAHKLHGPKGVGALYIRHGVRIPPYVHGGGQENGKRAGTVNTAGVVGLGVAAELAASMPDSEAARLRKLTERLWDGLQAAIPRIHRNSPAENALPGMLNICVEGAEGEAMLGYLDLEHRICVSSGSACTSGSLDPSHVLIAIGVAREIAHGSLRFSMSRYTSEVETDAVVDALPPIVKRLREMNPAWSE